ncbi:MAG: hypothetical protein HRU19_05120 [Pseudobacteriovorax sp.]|nr:hypothetical protein [Pseudobacteriovorax sp.]
MENKNDKSFFWLIFLSFVSSSVIILWVVQGDPIISMRAKKDRSPSAKKDVRRLSAVLEELIQKNQNLKTFCQLPFNLSDAVIEKDMSLLLTNASNIDETTTSRDQRDALRRCLEGQSTDKDTIHTCIWIDIQDGVPLDNHSFLAADKALFEVKLSFRDASTKRRISCETARIGTDNFMQLYYSLYWQLPNPKNQLSSYKTTGGITSKIHSVR